MWEHIAQVRTRGETRKQRGKQSVGRRQFGGFSRGICRSMAAPHISCRQSSSTSPTLFLPTFLSLSLISSPLERSLLSPSSFFVLHPSHHLLFLADRFPLAALLRRGARDRWREGGPLRAVPFFPGGMKNTRTPLFPVCIVPLNRIMTSRAQAQPQGSGTCDKQTAVLMRQRFCHRSRSLSFRICCPRNHELRRLHRSLATRREGRAKRQ